MSNLIFLRKEDDRMFQKYTGLYHTLYDFADAFITKWLKKENPTRKANDYFSKFLEFLTDTFSTFIG